MILTSDDRSAARSAFGHSWNTNNEEPVLAGFELTSAAALDERQQAWRRRAVARARCLLFARTSSVVQHRWRGCPRRRSGSRRAPAARPAVGCSFAPGAVRSAARIASLHHAWSGHGAAWLLCPTPSSAAMLPARHRARIAIVRPPRCRRLREWRSSRQRRGRLTRLRRRSDRAGCSRAGDRIRGLRSSAMPAPSAAGRR